MADGVGGARAATKCACLRLTRVLTYCRDSFEQELMGELDEGFSTCTLAGGVVELSVDSEAFVSGSVVVTFKVDVTLHYDCAGTPVDEMFEAFFDRTYAVGTLPPDVDFEVEISGVAVTAVTRIGPLAPPLLVLRWVAPGTDEDAQMGLSSAYVGSLSGPGSLDLVGGEPSAAAGVGAEAGTDVWMHAETGALFDQIDGAEANDELGFSNAGIGDVTLDGVPDLLTGVPSTAPLGAELTGSAIVYSGATRTPVRTHVGEAEGDQFGWSVAGIGDVDGDGVPDYAVGAPSHDPGGRTDAGTVYVYSGATGAEIYQVEGVASGDAFGFSVAGVDDVDGDGVPDILVGAITTAPGGRIDAGSAYLLSGVDGAVVWTFDAPEAGDGAGFAVAQVGDIDGDLVADMLVGAPAASPSGHADGGSIFIVSGADGSLLRRVDGAEDGDALGTSLIGLPDLDGDGVPDFASGAPDAGGSLFAWQGKVLVFSGATGMLIRTLNGTDLGEFGWSLAANGTLSDLQVLVGAPTESGGGQEDAGNLYAYELNDGTIQVLIRFAACVLVSTTRDERRIVTVIDPCAPRPLDP